jgi:hypothetical protein
MYREHYVIKLKIEKKNIEFMFKDELKKSAEEVC